MAVSTSLLAYLVPTLTYDVEDTATEALAFILNKSTACREELWRFLSDGEFALAPVVRVETQVVAEDMSRPDMVGYDANNAKRLLVESKFWANLQPSQTSSYLRQIDAPGALLFIVPDSRVETLWPEIVSQVEKDTGTDPDFMETTDGTRRARINDTNKRLMMVGWVRLLDRMVVAVSEDSQVASDILQLRGLAERKDPYLPGRSGSQELSPQSIFSVRSLEKLIDDVILRRGVPDGWVELKGRMAVRRKAGYGRYFGFTGVPGDLFLRIHRRWWERSAASPLWLQIYANVPVDFARLRGVLHSQIGDTGTGEWNSYNVPVYLKSGVAYEAVLDDVVRQLNEVAVVLGDLIATETT